MAVRSEGIICPLPRSQFATGTGYYGIFSGYFEDLCLTLQMVIVRSVKQVHITCFQDQRRSASLAFIFSMVVSLTLIGCKGNDSRSSLLPDNVKEDRPIVIKEGQAIVFRPESNKSLLICAGVVDGRLSVMELNQKGKSLSVTWSDSDSWETTIKNSTNGETTVIIDKDGDGLPDVRSTNR
jgi:hypothetical protein